MEIREAMLSDVSAIYAIDPMATSADNRCQHIRDWVDAGQAIVAVMDATVVGYSVLEYTFFGYGFIAVLIVKKESRRKGIATALITRLEELCETEKIFTSTNESNKPMQALMKSMSYEPSGILYNLDDGDPELFYLKRKKVSR